MIPFAICAGDGRFLAIDGIVDTGFSGHLTLPRHRIDRLQLAWTSREKSILADGSTCSFDVYDGVILWDGKTRNVEIEASECEPLVGMGLLRDHKATLTIFEGGPVTIEAISPS